MIGYKRAELWLERITWTSAELIKLRDQIYRLEGDIPFPRAVDPSAPKVQFCPTASQPEAWVLKQRVRFNLEQQLRKKEDWLLQQRELLDRVLASLPPPCRRIAVAKYLDGRRKTVPELMRETGIASRRTYFRYQERLLEEIGYALERCTLCVS